MARTLTGLDLVVRGMSTLQHPEWLRVVMVYSGRFEDWRVRSDLRRRGRLGDGVPEDTALSLLLIDEYVESPGG